MKAKGDVIRDVAQIFFVSEQWVRKTIKRDTGKLNVLQTEIRKMYAKLYNKRYRLDAFKNKRVKSLAKPATLQDIYNTYKEI